MDLIFSIENIVVAAKDFLAMIGTIKRIAFNGDMGVGKTTFIQAVCQQMGAIDTVSSPTFSIINEYKTIDKKTIYHIDLYRLKNEAEALNAGVEDCLFSNNFCFVEWPQRVPKIFPDDTLYVTLSSINTNTRKLKINL